MSSNDTIKLTVNIEDVGEKQISVDLKELMQHIKIEHLMLECPEGHSQEELNDVYFDCPKCRGTNFILEPTGEVFAALIRRQGLRVAKEALWGREG